MIHFEQFKTIDEAVKSLEVQKLLALINQGVKARAIAKFKQSNRKNLTSVVVGQRVFLNIPENVLYAHNLDLLKVWLFQGAEGTVVDQKHDNEYTEMTPNKLAFVHFDNAPEDFVDMVSVSLLQSVEK
jgi:hypothetical protein